MLKRILAILIRKALLKAAISISLFLLIASCSQGVVDPLDNQNGLTRNEVKKTLYGDRGEVNKKKSGSEIPKINSLLKVSKIITLPNQPKLIEGQVVSFSISDSVPLKDVLIELSKSAKLDLDLDSKIEGSIIVNAKNRPLSEVLDRICEMGDLRYTLENNVLHVERDLPFTKQYSVDFYESMWSEVEKNIIYLSAGGTVSSNKSSNIISVFTNQKYHKKVAEYLTQVRKSSSAQVLIEAKVIDVTLSDEFKTGINWSWLGATSSGGYDSTSVFVIKSSLNMLGGDLITPTISALEKFGTVKAVSSPRINALNNQKATLNFTKKLVYLTHDVSTLTNTTSSVTTTQDSIKTTIHTESAGTELEITPIIDLPSDEITLSIIPKITSKSSSIEVPYYSTITGDILGTDSIPVIDTKEIKTIAKIKSGNVLVIGGVMNEDTENSDSGIPFLSRIPILGYLFKSVSKVSSTHEAVIFIKATIIKPNEIVNKNDRDINNKFSSSARSIF